MNVDKARFSIGQVVHHNILDYRGVIVDVDAYYQGDDEWYERVAITKPPKDKPWYQILVHDSEKETYVSEKNLESDMLQEPVEHPLVDHFFECFENGSYKQKKTIH